MDTDKIKTLSFEQAFTALGESLEKLEAGDLPLAESLALYEYGMALAQHCNSQLDAAELKISKLGPAGELESLDR